MTLARWLFLAPLAAAAVAAAAPEPVLPAPIRHERLHSAVLDETREIWVSLPDGYAAGGERYPVVYLLDGELNFGSGIIGGVRQAGMLGEIPELILVAIRNTDRGKDIFPEEITYNDGTKDGGRADSFLAFIETELIPFVERSYRTEPQRILYGTSNTAFTAVYALFHNLALADTVIAASATLSVPSFQRALDQRLGSFPPGHHRLVLVTGEHDLPTVLRLNAALKEAIDVAAPPGLTCRLAVLHGAGHVPPDSLVEGLRLAFEGWRGQKG